MKYRWLVIAGAGLALGSMALSVADTAEARTRKARPACGVQQPYQFTFGGIFSNPRPRPNGCAPAVYAYGEYIGQDPDPNIRLQLLRDPETGYAYGLAH